MFAFLVANPQIAMDNAGPSHTTMNVSTYPSLDSVGVALAGNRLLFAGGKGLTMPRNAILYDIDSAQWRPAGSICADRTQVAGTSR